MKYSEIKKQIEEYLYELKNEQRTIETLLEAVGEVQEGIRQAGYTLLRNHSDATKTLQEKIDAISDEVDDLADEIGSDYYVKTRNLRRELKVWESKE